MAKRKGIFEAAFDVTKAPSGSSRYSSMERLTGGIKYNPGCDELSPTVKAVVRDQFPLREKLRTMSDPRTIPSAILRKKGIKTT